MTCQSEHKLQAVFWPLQTAGRERNSFLQAPQKCYIGNSKLRWLVQRAPLQWPQVVLMQWKGSLLHHSSEQQAQTVLAWRTLWTASCPQLSLLGKWFVQMCIWPWLVHQLLWVAAQYGMAWGCCLAEVSHSWKGVTMSLGKDNVAWGAFSLRLLDPTWSPPVKLCQLCDVSGSFSPASTRKIPYAEAKARAPNLGKEVSILRKWILDWDEGLPEELLCAVSGETLVTDQCVTQAITCTSQTRAFPQASDRSQERGGVLRGGGGGISTAG